jgi:hypothetical protein
VTFVRVQNEGEGVGAPSPSRPIGKPISTQRIFSTKSERDQGSLPKTKRGPAFVGDFIPTPTLKTRAAPEARSKKRPSYKPLPTQFRRDGFKYRQIARQGNAAIYEQTWCGCSEPSVCYEAIRIRRREGFQIGDRFVEAAEVYPNSEAWGVDGFTLTDKEAAFAKLSAMCAIPIPKRPCAATPGNQH